MWISPEFKIYLVREFLRLKDEENDSLKLDWKTSSFQRFRISAFTPIPGKSRPSNLHSTLQIPSLWEMDHPAS